jgi:putative ABC transport system permease protein
MVILLAAITMSMTARERVTEIAVLKAIGYDRRLVLTLMLTEFTIIAGLGGLLAGVGSRLFYRFVDMTQLTQGFLVNFFISGQTVAFCILASALVGVIAGGLPAMRSANMHVVDGLRKVI